MSGVQPSVAGGRVNLSRELSLMSGLQVKYRNAKSQTAKRADNRTLAAVARDGSVPIGVADRLGRTKLLEQEGGLAAHL